MSKYWKKNISMKVRVYMRSDDHRSLLLEQMKIIGSLQEGRFQAIEKNDSQAVATVRHRRFEVTRRGDHMEQMKMKWLVHPLRRIEVMRTNETEETRECEE